MLPSGTIVGVFEVESWLGSGAVASVYAVRHRTLGSRHALKVLAVGGQGIRERLIAEGAHQRGLEHPNIVTVTDVFLHKGEPVLLMERVDGPMLGDLLHAHRLSLADALALFAGILSAVSFAHQRGIVHRDLKPKNILLHVGSQGVWPKVADFGVNRALDPDGLNRTHTGIPLGFPAYMAPEQMKDGSKASVASDIFSLGCILFELITGTRCFTGTDIVTLVHQMLGADYIDPQQAVPGLPSGVSAAIRRAVSADPAQRFPTCEAFAAALFPAGLDPHIPVDRPCAQVAARLHREAEHDRLAEAMTAQRHAPAEAAATEPQPPAEPPVTATLMASTAIAVAAILAVGIVAAAAVLGQALD